MTTTEGPMPEEIERVKAWQAADQQRRAAERLEANAARHQKELDDLATLEGQTVSAVEWCGDQTKFGTYELDKLRITFASGHHVEFRPDRWGSGGCLSVYSGDDCIAFLG